jgi:DNA-directed RNA polymerase subunit RPC12/RpoP
MDKEKDVRHQFDLTGMKHGDWFLGCKRCWYQLPMNAAAANACPECGAKLALFEQSKSPQRRTTLV